MTDSASTYSTRDRWFPVVAASICAIGVLASTWAENDKRGLLRWDRPGAFVATKVTDIAGQGRYAITYLDQHGRRKRSIVETSPIRTPASRLIPAVSETETFAGTAGTLSTSPSDRPLDQLVPVSEDTPSPFAPGRGTQPAFTPGNLVGGETPFGLVAFNPDEPVVPAVPEPTAWLLMILGIGGLAYALRKQAENRQSESQGATA